MWRPSSSSGPITAEKKKKKKMESRRQRVKILIGTDSRVIGLKLAGSSLFPFLCIGTVQALFHSSGILPDLYIARTISVSNVWRYGHLLKQIMEIWSRGEGLPEVFVLRMTFVTFSNDGGSKLNGMVGFRREGIQLGMINFLFGQVDEKILIK